MNKINYDAAMLRVLGEARQKRVLLQACCAPCASHCLSELAGKTRVTVYFYNPNLSDREEYEKRRAELLRLIGETGWADALDCAYAPEDFAAIAAGYEDAPEGGARCARCFRLRLEHTAAAAKENGYDLFGTTLTLSPLKNAELIYQACGNKIQAIYVSGADFGTQNGPYMSLESFRKFYKPYHTRINLWIHEHTQWKTFFHSCGAVADFLQDFYESGVDILNPVQLSARGMDGKMLKEQWGDKFVFWGGGVDTQKTLPYGTPEEVYAQVQERLRIFGKGGGYVFGSIHNIVAKTPIENIMAMVEAVRDFNR